MKIRNKQMIIIFLKWLFCLKKYDFFHEKTANFMDQYFQTNT